MLKLGVFEGKKLVLRFALPNQLEFTTHAVVAASLEERGAPHVSAVAVASVGPHTDVLVNALKPLAPHATLHLHSGLNLGLTNAYEQPARVGIDRLLNVIAAHELYGGPAVVADLGTATNFDCVGAHGEFLGGAICTGPQLGLDALSSRSSQLLHVTFEQPPSLIATNTTDALRSGAYYGHAHLVDGLLRQFCAELGEPCHAIVTGGYAGALYPQLPSATHLAPELTLHGVRLAFERLGSARA